jgi:hypothetical protein
MRGLTGYEELVDPPMARRPLPFSRAWLAAFVLAVVAVAWVASVSRFDAQVLEADVVTLQQVVSELEKVSSADQDHLVSRQLLQLRSLAEAPATNGDARVERVWRRVEEVTLRAEAIDPADPQAVRLIAADLRAAAVELEELTARQNNVSSSESISRNPS